MPRYTNVARARASVCVCVHPFCRNICRQIMSQPILALTMALAIVMQLVFPLVVWARRMRRDWATDDRIGMATSTISLRSNGSPLLRVLQRRDRRNRASIVTTLVLMLMSLFAFLGAVSCLLMLTQSIVVDSLFHISSQAQCLSFLFVVLPVIIEIHSRVVPMRTVLILLGIVALYTIYNLVVIVATIINNGSTDMNPLTVVGDFQETIVFSIVLAFRLWSAVTILKAQTGVRNYITLLARCLQERGVEIGILLVLALKQSILRFAVVPLIASNGTNVAIASSSSVALTSMLMIASVIHGAGNGEDRDSTGSGTTEAEVDNDESAVRLRAVLSNAKSFRQFSAFCKASLCQENAVFWKDVSNYKDKLYLAMLDAKRPLTGSARHHVVQRMNAIFDRFLKDDSPFQVNLSFESVRCAQAVVQRINEREKSHTRTDSGQEGSAASVSSSTAASKTKLNGTATSGLTWASGATTQDLDDKRDDAEFIKRERPATNAAAQAKIDPVIWNDMWAMFVVFDECQKEVYDRCG